MQKGEHKRHYYPYSPYTGMFAYSLSERWEGPQKQEESVQARVWRVHCLYQQNAALRGPDDKNWCLMNMSILISLHNFLVHPNDRSFDTVFQKGCEKALGAVVGSPNFRYRCDKTI